MILVYTDKKLKKVVQDAKEEVLAEVVDTQ